MVVQVNQNNSAQVKNIGNDAYLIIIAGLNKDKYQCAKFNAQQKNNSQNLLNTPLKNTMARVALAGATSQIAQHFASKALPTALLGRINSSLYDIMSDGVVTTDEVAEDFIGSCTNQLDNVATNLGLPTPSALYTAIKPGGSGVISKDFVNTFMKSTQQSDTEANIQEAEQKNVFIVKLRLIQNDSQKLGIEIPTKKTEKNFNIATAINNQNMERSFDAQIVHADNKKTNMYDIKHKLEKIRDLKEHIDVYINDKDVLENEVFKDVLLSDLEFSVENKNVLSCSLSITKVPEWDVIIDTTLDKSLSNTKTSNSNKTTNKRPQKGNNLKVAPKQVKYNPETMTSTDSAQHAFDANCKLYTSAKSKADNFTLSESARNSAKNQMKYAISSATSALNNGRPSHTTPLTSTDVERLMKQYDGINKKAVGNWQLGKNNIHT